MSKCFPNICHICSKRITDLRCTSGHYLGQWHNGKVESLLNVWAKQNKCIPPKKIFDKHENWERKWAELYDKPIPQEILSKCLPNFCHICSKKSPHAKSHYLSQGHNVKVESLLNVWAKQNECIAPKKIFDKHEISCSIPIQDVSHSEKNKKQNLEAEKRHEGLQTSIDPSNKGFEMLAKMGYKSGQSLGKSNSGIVDPIPIPIEVKMKNDRSGIGEI